jgi:restriction endonuclease
MSLAPISREEILANRFSRCVKFCLDYDIWGYERKKFDSIEVSWKTIDFSDGYESIPTDSGIYFFSVNHELYSKMALSPVTRKDKTIYDYIRVDSKIEKAFARDCEADERVKFFFKLPNGFKIPTPIGHYIPD